MAAPEPRPASVLEGVDPALLLRLSRPGPRYTSYPTAPVWTDEVGRDELVAHLQRANEEGAASPLSLYFHLPFCRAMCTYCGCNVVVARRPERADRYLDYLEREMDLVCEELPQRRRVMQLHLGGGTPTFLDLRQLDRLWQAIRGRFDLAPAAEVALEIDPVVTSVEQLRLLRRLGFNRVSLGVQDFAPEVQEYVGRVQSVELTRGIYQEARALGYAGINFDLIYGLPKQRLDSYRRTLETVIEMAPDRVAVFSYAHVPWMRSQQRRIDEKLLPSPVDKFALFALAHRLFLEAGYVQIGMDHFARPEDELAQARLARRLKRNFQGYTVNPATDTLAFGITGISDVQGCYAQSVRTLPRYYRELEADRLPVERGRVLSADDRLRRQVISSIMCNFHVDLGEVCASLGVDPHQTFASELARLAEAERSGLLQRDELRLELTPLGRVLVRNVAMVFDAYLPAQPAAGTFSRTI